MTLYRITILETQDQYFVEAETSDQAIDEVRDMLNIQNVSGDVEEVLAQ